MLSDNRDELGKLGCSLDSDVETFFARMPGRMKKPPPDADDIFKSVADAVEDLQAGTVREMMEIVSLNQMTKILTQAGGKATWTSFLEMIVGFKFGTNGVPHSAQLVQQDVKMGPPGEREPTFQVKPLGEVMLTSNTLQVETLPEYVFDAVGETEDPSVQAISSNDVTSVLNAYQHYMMVTHKQPSGDKPLRLHHAKILKARLPHLPDYGKTPGQLRQWFNLLTERKRNFARTSALKQQALKGLTFTKEEAENLGDMIKAGFVPRVITRPSPLNFERKPLDLANEPRLLTTTVSPNEPKGQPPPPPMTQADRDKADKIAAMQAALAALDSEGGGEEDEGAAPDGDNDNSPDAEEGDGGPCILDGVAVARRPLTAKQRRAQKAEAAKQRKAELATAKENGEPPAKRQRKKVRSSERHSVLRTVLHTVLLTVSLVH